MAKTKRKINKQSVMQKQQWKYMRRRYPFLVPVRHWYTGMKMTKKEIKNNFSSSKLLLVELIKTAFNMYRIAISIPQKQNISNPIICTLNIHT